MVHWKTSITTLLIFISMCVNSQENLLNQPTYCFIFCGTTAQDTNTFSFLKSSYENAILSLKDDSLLMILELSEDEVFIQRHEKKNIISSLYELEESNIKGEKSITGKILQDKYAGLYYEIIQQSILNPKIVLRGYKNPIQHAQLGWIMKYFPELINENERIEISNTISNKTKLRVDLYEKFKSKLISSPIDSWDKAYVGTWLDDLSKLYSNEPNSDDENDWNIILRSVDKKIILSPFEQASQDYIPSHLKKYFSNPTRILLLVNKVVLTNREKYKTIINKKYKSQVGFEKHITDTEIYLFDNESNKYKYKKLIIGSYYGNW